MTITFAFISIFCIAGVAWSVDRLRIFPFRVCAICAGSAGTWLILLVLRALGITVDATVIAVLTGGSAVGIAYQGEKMLLPGKNQLLWKMLFIPIGFLAAYALANEHWILALFVILVLVMLALIFLNLFPRRRSETVDQEKKNRAKIEKMLDECC